MALKNLTRDSFKWTNGRGHDQKPILYSVKNNLLGLGKSLHVAQTDNWWERAFDNSLKSLAVSETHDGGIKVVQEEVKGGGIGLKQVVGMGKGKYAERIKFVKGGLLEGTLTELKTEVVERVVGEDAVAKAVEEVKRVEGAKKRKRREVVVVGEEKGETKDERRKRRKKEKAAKELKRQEEKAKKAKKAQEKVEKKKVESKSKSTLKTSESEDREASSTTISPPPTKKHKKSTDEAPLPTPPSSGEVDEQLVVKKDKKDKKDKKNTSKKMKKSNKGKRERDDSDSKQKSKPASKSKIKSTD